MRDTELDYLVGLRTLLFLLLIVSTETFIMQKVHRQDGKPQTMRYIKGLEEQSVMWRKMGK